ncbi:MAG: DNA-processing protein DprA [Peptostreptococcaceae bacterium]
MNRKDSYLWLNSIEGITNKVIDKIIDNGINLEELIYLNDKEILNLKNINLNIKENIVKYKSITYLNDIKDKLNKKSIEYICIDDKNYPNNLKHIHNAPKVLFYKGEIDILNKDINLAMVGARKSTDYGISCAKKISKSLSDVGINIVSGLALGIDYYSHVGALNGASKTIAVLGSSVNNPLPKQNLKLSEKILEDGGLILSEYNINDKIFPSNFSNRNRIISGISDGVIVVEAAEKSGALITVEFALEHGKNVFAVPGNINSYMSRGCHKIIKEGAKLIEDIDDILNEYNINCTKYKEDLKKCDNIDLSEQQKRVIESIKNQGVLHIDEICANTRMEIKKVNSILNELVLRDFLIELRNKTYSLNI